MTPQPPPAIDIDQLRELAKASADTWAVPGRSWWDTEALADYFDGVTDVDDDAAYIAAASPSVILALLQQLAELRAMRTVVRDLVVARIEGLNQVGPTATWARDMREIERLTR